MFGIWAEVWGGMTRRRCAWLKADGAIQRFDRQQAEAEATRLAVERAMAIRIRPRVSDTQCDDCPKKVH
jgi:hypothetical protein